MVDTNTQILGKLEALHFKMAQIHTSISDICVRLVKIEMLQVCYSSNVESQYFDITSLLHF